MLIMMPLFKISSNWPEMKKEVDLIRLMEAGNMVMPFVGTLGQGLSARKSAFYGCIDQKRDLMFTDKRKENRESKDTTFFFSSKLSRNFCLSVYFPALHP